MLFVHRPLLRDPDIWVRKLERLTSLFCIMKYHCCQTHGCFINRTRREHKHSVGIS